MDVYNFGHPTQVTDPLRLCNKASTRSHQCNICSVQLFINVSVAKPLVSFSVENICYDFHAGEKIFI